MRQFNPIGPLCRPYLPSMAELSSDWRETLSSPPPRVLPPSPKSSFQVVSPFCPAMIGGKRRNLDNRAMVTAMSPTHTQARVEPVAVHLPVSNVLKPPNAPHAAPSPKTCARTPPTPPLSGRKPRRLSAIFREWPMSPGQESTPPAKSSNAALIPRLRGAIPTLSRLQRGCLGNHYRRPSGA